jgi:hypothetical protein
MSKQTTPIKKHNQKEWLQMFDRLATYKATHSNCNVPKRYTQDAKLGHWVHYQRTMYKVNKLAEERIELLEDIGFVWKERSNCSATRENCSWEDRYEELKQFQKAHGHCTVPRKGKSAALGRWVKWQRWNRTLLDRGESSVLNKAKIKLLNALGFNWGYQRVPAKKKHIAASENGNPPHLPCVPLELSPPRTSIMVSNDDFNTLPNHALGYSNPFDCTDIRSTTVHQGINMQIGMQESYKRSTSSFDDSTTGYCRRDTGSTNTSSLENFPRYTMRGNDEVYAPSISREHSTFSNGIQTLISTSINKSRDYPLIDQNYKMQVWNQPQHQQQGTHNANVSSPGWKCSVCRVASFQTYKEALTHENDCTGVPATKGYLGDLMCRACAA